MIPAPKKSETCQTVQSGQLSEPRTVLAGYPAVALSTKRERGRQFKFSWRADTQKHCKAAYYLRRVFRDHVYRRAAHGAALLNEQVWLTLRHRRCQGEDRKGFERT